MFSHLAFSYTAPAPISFSQNQFVSIDASPLPLTILQKIREQTTLADALNVLANHAHLQFVLEGVPARLPTDKPTIAKLIGEITDSRKPITFRQLTIALADNYGYEVEVKEQGKVWVFHKTYTNAADFPEVTAAEMNHFLRSVLLVVQPYNPEMPFEAGIDTRIRDFAQTLTPEMLEKMKGPPETNLLPPGLFVSPAPEPSTRQPIPGGVPVTSLFDENGRRETAPRCPGDT